MLKFVVILLLEVLCISTSIVATGEGNGRQPFLRTAATTGGKHWPPILFGAVIFEGARYVWDYYTRNKETSKIAIDFKENPKQKKTM